MYILVSSYWIFFQMRYRPNRPQQTFRARVSGHISLTHDWLLTSNIRAQWRTHLNDSFRSLVNHLYHGIQHSIAYRYSVTDSLLFTHVKIEQAIGTYEEIVGSRLVPNGWPQ